MRVPFLIIAASLALVACKNSDMHDNTSNVDENLTAENIVSNDVTAIDAVTGDAANMAADVDVNYASNVGNSSSGQSSQPTRTRAAAPKSKPQDTADNSAAPVNQTATNSE